jgi:hypothetical protein
VFAITTIRGNPIFDFDIDWHVQLVLTMHASGFGMLVAAILPIFGA